MSIFSKLSGIKTKIYKFFFRKDTNYSNAVKIGLIIAVFVSVLYGYNFFGESERYLQALIYQLGYKLPKNPNLVTVVKKDQTTSSLLKKDPNDRHIHSSLFNFLGQRQKRETKNRPLNFELLNIKFGLFENIRNQHIVATSFDSTIRIQRTFVITSFSFIVIIIILHKKWCICR